MKYVLLSGVHADKNGVFAPGDVVESESNLEERFPERFIAYDPTDDDPNIPEQEENR